MTGSALYQALQLGDSAFPIGVFSFSQALERFVQDGLVTEMTGLSEYLHDLLEQVAWTDGIALLAACDAATKWDRLIDIDQEIGAFKLGKESRAMTTKTGRQLLRLGAELWPEPLADLALLTRQGRLVPTYPVALGCVATAAGLTRSEAFVLELYSTAASVCGAALRLMRIDHLQIQRLLLQANAWSGALLAECEGQTLSAMRTSGPLLEIEGMRHERSFVRMFAN